MPYTLVEDAPAPTSGGYTLVEDAAAPPEDPRAGWFDRMQAAAAGMTRGAITNIPGMPVDTALNVADLARAVYGYGGSKLGLFPAGDAPQPLERGKYPGSSEWIANKERQGGLGPSIDPNRPGDTASRVLFAGGQGVFPALMGGAPSVGKAVGLGTAGAASQAASQSAQEAGLPPSMQVLASFAPALTAPLAAVYGEQQMQRAQANQARNADAAKNFKDTTAAGYVYPPAQTNPNLGNKIANSFGGKIATQQDAALRNEAVSGDLARQAIGLPADVPLNPKVTASVRAQAYQNGYEPVKQFGALGVDKQYLADINGIETGYMNDKGSFETLRVPAVEKLITDAKQPLGLDSNSAVGMIRNLRDQASANINSPSADPQSIATGYAQKKVAGALEDLIGRNLAAAGQTDALGDFQKARKTIAQSHTVDEITDPISERVDARKAYAQLKSGVPLEGPLLIVAKAGAFGGPAAKMNVTGGGGSTVFDTLPAVLGGAGGLLFGHQAGAPAEGAATGFIAGAGLPVARHIARAGMLSDFYQSRFGAPPENTIGYLARLAAMSPEARQMIGTFAVPAQDAGNQ